MDCRIKSGNDSLAMRTDLFDFELPAGSIALRPASPRDSARMLIVQPDGVLLDRVVADLPHWLEAGDQLVVNDTKVIAAKLSGRRIGRATEPRIEATLIKRLDGSRFVSGDVKTWHWTLVREDCDAVVADPEFVLQGGERPVLMFQAVRPSNYHFTLKVVGAAGDSGSCKFDVPTDGRGMRVELCWDTSQNTDLDMYLHNPFDRAPWFTAGVGMLADGINGTTCNVANCTANLRLGLRALISVSPIRHSRTAKLARRLMNSKRSAAVPIRATAKTTTSR